MLKQLEVTNLKSIDKSVLRLAPLTILTGCNSSGKSTILQALMLIMKYSLAENTNSMRDLLRHLDDFKSIRNKKKNAKEIHLKVEDDNNQSHSINITNDTILEEIDTNLNYEYEATDERHRELFFLSANRIGAEDITFKSGLKVGMIGEYLFSYYEKIKSEPLPEYLINFEGSNTIAYQLSKWLELVTGTEIELVTEDVGGNVKITFNVKDLGGNVSPFNLGAGISYVAKVLIICLIAKKGDLILLENPAIQLHPKSQALLGTFLCFIASKGIQVVAETHCEHLINKVRYEVYKDNINNNDVVLHYKPSVDDDFFTLLLDNKGKYISEDQERIGFPAGFFDSTLDDLFKMGG